MLYIGENVLKHIKRNTWGTLNYTQLVQVSLTNDACMHDHRINLDKGHIIDRGNYGQRKTLESGTLQAQKMQTTTQKTLPEQYVHYSFKETILVCSLSF